jgi:hypothetical protein
MAKCVNKIDVTNIEDIYELANSFSDTENGRKADRISENIIPYGTVVYDLTMLFYANEVIAKGMGLLENEVEALR